MKKTIIAILQLQLITPTLPAAVPLRWTVETSRVDPAVFDAYQGETLTFEAALQSNGKPLAAPVNYSFFWQTNGMGSTYWEVKVRGEGEQRNNSTVHLDPSPSPTNVLFATWSPEMDVGAKVYNCFIGSPSNIYHAAFQLRLRPSPGALPNALPLPTPVIDFAKVRVLNPPWGSGGGGGGCDTNAVDILANSAVVTNALTVATTNRVAALETHVTNTNNPHKVTAEQVGAVPFVEDKSGNKTAVTIGSRKHGEEIGKRSLANGNEVIASEYASHAEGNRTTASGYASHAEGGETTASGGYSHAEGNRTTASGDYSHAEGDGTTASGYASHAEGYLSQTKIDDVYAFAWNGDILKTEEDPYKSHGPGTFNINPLGGLDGFYIGEQTLHAILTNKADKADISATNPTFSNAVLAVGLNIDTNSVAVLNEIADTFGGFPLGAGETATTVGGLLAALAAAAAWLKKNKVQTLKLNDGSIQTSADGGVAKLDDFFTESNSLLMGTIAANSARLAFDEDGEIIVTMNTED